VPVLKSKDVDDSIPSTMVETESVAVDEDEDKKGSTEGSVDMLVRNPGKDVSELYGCSFVVKGAVFRHAEGEI
jgi:hypothetical protein